MKLKLFDFKILSPKSLYGRFLFIIILPILLVQITGVYVFYYRNWGNMSKHMAKSFVKEVTLARDLIRDVPDNLTEREYNEILKEISIYFNIDVRFYKDRIIADNNVTSKKIDLEHDTKTFNPFVRLDPFNRLKHELKTTFKDNRFNLVSLSEDELLLLLELDTGLLNIVTHKKQVTNPSILLYILASLIVSLVIVIISILFLKNQIRSIKNLTKAVQILGKGHESFSFKPSGALEIRKAGISFLKMRKRIQSFIKQRTEMLSSISHDLRTPLTRMKLELEMTADNEVSQSLKEDINDMERMIDEYLEFAKGESAEKFKKNDIKAIIEKTVFKYKKIGKNLNFVNNLKEEDFEFEVRCKAKSIERVLNNIIDNGFKYGKDFVRITLDKTNKTFLIIIEDNGNGLSNEEKEKIFKPFYRGDNARNLDEPSTGLGMSIVKDIIKSHGGKILLRDSELGGLKVKIFLPL